MWQGVGLKDSSQHRANITVDCVSKKSTRDGQESVTEGHRRVAGDTKLALVGGTDTGLSWCKRCFSDRQFWVVLGVCKRQDTWLVLSK